LQYKHCGGASGPIQDTVPVKCMHIWRGSQYTYRDMNIQDILDVSDSDTDRKIESQSMDRDMGIGTIYQ
jgi:hypothetical protein